MAAAGSKPAKPKPDPRYLALRNFTMSISVFNIFGYSLLGFEQPWIWPIFAVLVAYTAELLFEVLSAWANRRPPRFMSSTRDTSARRTAAARASRDRAT